MAQTTPDARDSLLAALGVATLECLGTVKPLTYDASTGTLTRTFGSCPVGGPRALAQVDALLGVQRSVEGMRAQLPEHYVACGATRRQL